MDIIKFNSWAFSRAQLMEAEIVNGITSKMWVERYLESGEFTFVAPLSSGLKETLPIGSIISHVNTPELMIVENHEIKKDAGSESQITISGRGFETFFENRFVGSNGWGNPWTTVTDWAWAADYTWNQAKGLLDYYTGVGAFLVDTGDEVNFIKILTSVAGPGTSQERAFKVGSTVYANLLEFLAIDNLGMRVGRPGPWSPLYGGPDALSAWFLIHRGLDKTASVIFSHETGEIKDADYLWSSKNLLTTAIVRSTWLIVRVPTFDTNVWTSRRMRYVEALDVDESYTATPTGADLTKVTNALYWRGKMELENNKGVSIIKVDVAKDNNFKYRTDFNTGDIITVNGEYNASTPMRVSEYVEIEDSNGESGYPTLITV